MNFDDIGDYEFEKNSGEYNLDDYVNELTSALRDQINKLIDKRGDADNLMCKIEKQTCKFKMEEIITHPKIAFFRYKNYSLTSENDDLIRVVPIIPDVMIQM